MSGDERLQLADQPGVAAEHELGVEPLLECDDTQLVEPRRLEPGELLLVEVGERRAVPESERLGEQRGASLAGRRRATSPRRRSNRFASTSSGSIASR